MSIKKLVKSNVSGLKAYAAKDIPCRVKLDANESPYGLEMPMGIKSNRYPDPEARALRALIARGHRLRPANILMGNGSDELIYYLINVFGGPVLYPTPTFVMYGMIAQALGERGLGIPLDPGDFSLDLDAMLGAIEEARPGIAFLSTPNNPTGNAFDPAAIMKIIEAMRGRGVVVVDEAYQAFGRAPSMAPLVKGHEHLIVMRTLSKIGLAALRVGYLIAGEEVVDEVNKVRLPYNLNAVSQALAARALGDRAAMNEAVRAIKKERARLMRALGRMPGVRVYPSEANFMLLGVGDAGAVHGGLLRRGVLVKDLSAIIPGALRVTVGTPEENEAFLDAIGDITDREGGRQA